MMRGSIAFIIWRMGKYVAMKFVIVFLTAKVVCGLETPVKAFLSASKDKLMISWNSGIMMRMTGW